MLREKINSIIHEVNEELAEREELVHTIALALLTRKNLFVLGEPGQAKSQAIDSFRAHISDANQFEILMSKGIDQEQLFGRLDLASIIPGHISKSVLKNDTKYREMKKRLAELMEKAQTEEEFRELSELDANMSRYISGLAKIYGNSPEIITEGKIPDSHICFLDEVFKANDGVLNSLLKALNERVYTNEGITTEIPVISFFSASNEIPNFNNPEEKSLKALYDRFDFKVCTKYVEDKANRMRILKNKQSGNSMVLDTSITIAELEQMQLEVRAITVPDSINELADNILCELRRKGIPVSDRIYFNFTPVVQAKAYLAGRDTVKPEDMSALVNYLWDKPEEYAVVKEVITRLTENPLGEEIDKILASAYKLRDDFEKSTDKVHGLASLREKLLDLYGKVIALRAGIDDDDAANTAIDGAVDTLNEISKVAHSKTSYTHVDLKETFELRNIA